MVGMLAQAYGLVDVWPRKKMCACGLRPPNMGSNESLEGHVHGVMAALPVGLRDLGSLRH